MSGGPDTPVPAAGAPVAEAPAAAPVASVTAPVAAPEPVASPAPAPAPAAAPAVETPAPAVADAAPAPAADPAKPAETSLLSELAKPAEAAPPADGTPAAEAPIVEAAPLPLPAYDLKLPEGFEAAPDQLGKFNELLGKFEQKAGGDHVKFQEFGQEALAFHVSELQRVTDAAAQQSAEAWETMRDGWRDTFRTDPELGGNREKTTLAACAGVIDQFGGNAAQRAELRKYLAVTGMGDHPALIRILSNVAKVLGEPNPVPANTPVTPKASRATRRYANTNGAA